MKNVLLFILFFGVYSKGFGQVPTKQVELGSGVSLELVYIKPGEFKMGSTLEEKIWATGWEGGAQPGSGLPGTGTRESYEGEKPLLVNVKDGFWMGRTEVTVGQFKRFIEETGYVTDAEKPGGETEVFDPEWKITGIAPPHPWISVKGKSWRDPNFGFPLRDVYPVVCVSYNDDNAYCEWLTKKERAAGRLPAGMVYRLPTEAEWEYAARGGKEGYFWWGNDLSEGEGRLNISGIDFLPGRNKTWVYNKVPWSDGFAFVSPVDFYGEKGRNGFGLADMCGGVWEFVLDDFDPKGGHEKAYFGKDRKVVHNVCKGGNYFDVPGNARCAVRLGIKSVDYSDSRDGFRICLGKPVERN
jgi:formylglycine-generating enzyme required for sulfatase activity